MIQAEGNPLVAPSAGELSQLPLESSRRQEITQALHDHDYGHAETVLLRAANEHPADALFYNYLGNIFFLDHKYLNAVIAMKKAEAITPLKEKDRFTLAMAYIILGRRAWAEPELEKLALANPREPLYPYWQGRLDYQRQDFVSATEKFKNAIAIDPGFMKAYDNLGLSLEGLNQDDEALQQYRQAVVLNGQRNMHSAWPSLNLATLLIKYNRLQEAQSSLQEALGIDPAFEPAHLQLGILLEKRNDLARAAEELRKAAVLDHADPAPHCVLARVEKRSGKLEQSIDEVRVCKTLEAKTQQPHLE